MPSVARPAQGDNSVKKIVKLPVPPPIVNIGYGITNNKPRGYAS